MTNRDRLIELLLDQRKPDAAVDEERLNRALHQENPDADVDWEEVQDALGYSSLQALAFLKSVNAEFGTELSPESLMNAKGTGGLLALLK